MLTRSNYTIRSGVSRETLNRQGIHEVRFSAWEVHQSARSDRPNRHFGCAVALHAVAIAGARYHWIEAAHQLATNGECEQIMSKGGATTANGLLDQLTATIDNAQLVHCELDHLHRLAMVGIIAAGVAHEVNNLLTPAIAYLHAAIGSDADEAAQAKALRKGLAAAEQVTAISRAMLGFAGSSYNQQDIANVAASLDNALDCVGRDPRRDGISFSVDIPSDMQVTIAPVALQQVLMNLVLNACEAVRARRGWVRVSATKEGGWVKISVRDNGPGIPESIRSRLFEPFATSPSGETSRQADASIGTARHSGTGLGLVVCKMLVDAAHGEIHAESDPDRGTEFTIIIRSAMIDAHSTQNAA